MEKKRIYVKPTFKVVEMKISSLLLYSAGLQGYEYQEDGWKD